MIAIVPPEVVFTLLNKVESDSLKELQKKESEHLQKMTLVWLKLWKNEGHMSVGLQDAETTNTRLKTAGYFDGRPMSPYDICDSLGVDAVIISNYSLRSTTLKEDEMILVQLLGAEVFIPANNAIATIELHDKETKKIIWNYHYHSSGLVSTSTTELIDNMLRVATKNMPYYR